MPFFRWCCLSVVMLGVGCGKSESGAGADAGVQPLDAGVDAGPAAKVCLPDLPDAGASTDAGFDFTSCRGRPLEPGGQATLVISGLTTKAGITNLAGVQLDLLGANGAVLASTTSADGGSYRLSYDAGCEPVAGEVRATYPQLDAGFHVSYAVPPAPWSFDREGLDLVLFDVPTVAFVAQAADVTVVDQSAVLALTVVDCRGNSVEGAVVSTAGGNGVVRYVGPNGLPVSGLAGTRAKGDVVIFNLLGSSVSVSATLDGGLIGQRVVPLHADSATGTFLTP